MGRVVLRVAVGVAGLAAAVQAWVTYDWIGGLDDHCDYPEECTSTWLPQAFDLAEQLWVVVVLAGTAALTTAGLLRRPPLDVAVLGGAVVAAFASYCLTPMVQADRGVPITDRPQTLEADPLFWGGPGYSLAAALMAVSAAAFAWQLLRAGSPAAGADRHDLSRAAARPAR